jgi:hypothetical protein
MNQLLLKCRCGTVKGSLSNVSPDMGSHIKCYCEDCRAFANHIAPDEEILDEFGATEIFQSAPWNLTITDGIDQLECLRLTNKGLRRWYAKCCNTPVANTIKADLPFLGIVHSFIDKGDNYEQLVGPIIGHYKLKGAIGDVPADIKKMGMPLKVTLQIVWRLIKCKFTMKGKSNIFFTADGKTITKAIILNE